MEGDGSTIGDVAGTWVELEAATIDETIFDRIGNGFDNVIVYKIRSENVSSCEALAS